MSSPQEKHDAAYMKNLVDVLADVYAETYVCSNCPSHSTNYCSACFEPGTSTREPMQTFYCNKICQKADWPLHRPLCLGRRQIKQALRAAWLIQKAFFIYRNHINDVSIHDVKKLKNGDIHIFEGAYAPGQALVPFPTGLVASNRDREAIMGRLAGSNALIWIHEMIEEILSGFCELVEEVRIATKRPLQKVIFFTRKAKTNKHQPDTRNLVHRVLKLHLRNGGPIFCLDYAGGQHGYYEPLVPWTAFLETRVHTVLSTEPFGTLLAQTDNGNKLGHGSYIMGKIINHHQRAKQSVRVCIGIWGVKAGMTLKMLGQVIDDKVWRKNTFDLLDEINETLLQFMKCLDQVMPMHPIALPATEAQIHGYEVHHPVKKPMVFERLEHN